MEIIGNNNGLMMHLENGELKQALKNLVKKHFTQPLWNAFADMNLLRLIIKEIQKKPNLNPMFMNITTQKLD